MSVEDVVGLIPSNKGPQGVIVHTHIEDSVTYEVEKLDPPLLRGAGLRHYRLWEDRKPCSGRQYHYEFKDALVSIKQLVQYSHYDEVKILRDRISHLERSNRLANALLADEEPHIRGQDVWFEVKELKRMDREGTPEPDIEAQEKRIRTMLCRLDCK